jgi:N6-adenosine-specific RNA methylase IME4
MPSDGIEPPFDCPNCYGRPLGQCPFCGTIGPERPNEPPEPEPPTGVRTIVADPPWPVRQPPRTFGGKGNSPLPYAPMSVADITALRVVPDRAADVCHLYLWTVNRYVRDAYDVADAWGFRPTMLLTWCKEPLGDGPGWEYSSATEFVLFCKRGTGQWPRPMPHETRNWWSWPRSGGHSSKPEAFYDMVERVSPGPYLDVFSRRARLGWTTWGDQSLHGSDLTEMYGDV